MLSFSKNRYESAVGESDCRQLLYSCIGSNALLAGVMGFRREG